ncbi:hypothetical protein, partial [Paracidovorax cattleyae]|uniref:hypothetical protein n=1 Tax=Paracidovorax cattleyae TaxID=80868 RepID=UPI001CEF5E5F
MNLIGGKMFGSKRVFGVWCWLGIISVAHAEYPVRGPVFGYVSEDVYHTPLSSEPSGVCSALEPILRQRMKYCAVVPSQQLCIPAGDRCPQNENEYADNPYMILGVCNKKENNHPLYVGNESRWVFSRWAYDNGKGPDDCVCPPPSNGPENPYLRDPVSGWCADKWLLDPPPPPPP